MERLKTESELVKLLDDFGRLYKIENPVEMGEECYKILNELNYSSNECQQTKIFLDYLKVEVNKLMQLFSLQHADDKKNDDPDGDENCLDR